MTDILLSLTLLTGAITMQVRLFQWLDRTAKSFDEDRENGIAPRLDHAAPGRGRAPAALCLMLERAGLPADFDPEAPCT